MKKLLEVLFLGIGALGLFALALIGFAQMVGAPMSELPVFGSFFAKAEAELQEEHAADELATDVNGVPVDLPGGPLEPDELPPPPPEYSDTELQLEDVITSTRAAIANYVVSSPFSREELVNLQRELNQSLKRSRSRLEELDQRELDLEEYAQLLEEKAAEIDQLRQGLDRAEGELQNLRRSLDDRERQLNTREGHLDKREQSIRSQEVSLSASERAQLDQKASLFVQMDPEMAVSRLEALPIEEARRIFQRLPADVAEEFLNVMPDELWTQFLDAFTEAP
jgi:DNA repair exonuclease SbcCD ATPase subunit